MSPFQVTFVTKSDCHLCEKAEPMVMRWASLLSATVKRVSIEEDPAAEELYFARIPVVLGPDGSVLAEGVISSGSLGRAMFKARLGVRRSPTG